ncbi:MAG TPA: type IV pilus secretin PilQ [Candidatus Binatia bacterium]|nr:type IV pilus secretin PilQ [Candidatus Binatia bacterium]
MMGNMLMDGLTWRFARSYRIQAKTCTWVGMMALTGALGVSGCSVNGTTPTQSPAAQTPATAKPAAKSQSAAAASYPIRDLIVREEKGQTFLQIKFGQPVTQYRHFTLPQPARIVLDVLDDVKSAETTDLFRIDSGTVATLRLTSGETNLRLVLETSAATVPTYSISQDDGGLRIVVGTADPNINAKRNVVMVQGGQRLDVRQAGALASPTGVKPRAVQDGSGAEKPYSGQKISLDFKDADIKNVFRLLADVSGLNIVVTSDVNRRVTLRLVEVPWDQAMDLIIATNGLEKEQLGNVVRISTADALKGERDKLIAAKESREKLDPIQTIYFTLNYARAKDLEPKIRPLMSKRTDAALVIDDRSNTIMVRDIQKSLDDVSTMVGKLDSRTPQILIESNLVETTPSFSRALGMELDSVFNDGRIITSSRFLAGAPFAGSPQGIANQLIVPSSGFRFGYFGNNIRGILSAAENEGNIKIISRPSIVTLNNIPSTIKSERILRITLPSSTNIASGSGAAAGTAVATEKIPVGINLTVIPQVSSDGFVLLNIKVKSSSIANSPTVAGGTGGVVPFDELNREAEANVLVKDGETIVIGGILKDSDANATGGIPYLKDVPYLGWLFKNWRIQKEFEELVVFITPRIASAGSENLPTAEELWREQMKKTQGDQVSSFPANP